MPALRAHKPSLYLLKKQIAEQGLAYILKGQHESRDLGIHMNFTIQEISTGLPGEGLKD